MELGLSRTGSNPESRGIHHSGPLSTSDRDISTHEHVRVHERSTGVTTITEHTHERRWKGNEMTSPCVRTDSGKTDSTSGNEPAVFQPFASENNVRAKHVPLPLRR